MSRGSECIPADTPDDSPDWIIALRRACHQTSQRRVASTVGYSPAVISLILRGVYGGNLGAVEARVRRRLMNNVLICPVKGEITTNECLSIQARPFNASSSASVALWRSCLTCPNSRTGGQ